MLMYHTRMYTYVHICGTGNNDQLIIGQIVSFSFVNCDKYHDRQKTDKRQIKT